MRQTDLSFEQIVERIPVGCDGGCDPEYPACLMVNELGELAQAGERRAFTELAELLVHEEDGVRAIAFAWLCRLDPVGHSEQLGMFAGTKRNERIMVWAREQGLTLPA